MNILHYIPTTDKKSLQALFLKEMIEGERDGMTSHIVTMEKGGEEQAPSSSDIDKLSPYSLMTISGHRQFKKIVDKIKPDVVHIHALWGLAAWLVFRWAEEERLPIVVSPYKALMKWNYGRRYALSKLPQLLFMQHYMLTRAAAIHAVTRQEFDTLYHVSWHPDVKSEKPWNDRIALVEYSKELADGHVDTERVGEEMSVLYRKVIDSNPFLLMNDEDREVENMLLAYGTSLDSGVPMSEVFLDGDGIKDKVTKLSPEHWRRILLHCADQGILQQVVGATERLGVEIATPDVQGISRFRIEKELPFLETANPRIKVARMHQLDEDYTSYEAERTLCVMLLNTKYLYAKRILSRRNLADLYAAIRFGQYNEYMLENMLDEIGMKNFASRIFYILYKSMNLEEGFIPFDMLCDRRTKNIIKILFKSNMQ